MPKRESAYFKALNEAQKGAEAPRLTLPTRAPEEAEEETRQSGKPANSLASKAANPQSALPVNVQTAKEVNHFAGEQAKRFAGEAANPQSVEPANSLDVKKQTVYLPKALAKRAKHYATEQERTISDIAVEALEEYLQRRGQ